MSDQMHIPHNRVSIQDDVLQKETNADDFVKQMSHELRTPLNVIIGLCQYLERDTHTPLSEIQLDTVERMERNAVALLASVNRFLECVRSGKYD